MQKLKNLSQFSQIMGYLLEPLKVIKGQSLTEFAVITAMMATFIATAVPKYSDLMETGKGQKSIEELDKLLVQAKNFYEETATLEGRGRLPGQDKYDMKVGEYTNTQDLFDDLEQFTSFTNQEIGEKWVSVFGTENSTAPSPYGSFFVDDTITPAGFGFSPGGKKFCSNCAEVRETGADAWYRLFTREILESPYQDGHYIYVVIPGSGTGNDAKSPKICVADAEYPKGLHKFIDL